MCAWLLMDSRAAIVTMCVTRQGLLRSATIGLSAGLTVCSKLAQFFAVVLVSVLWIGRSGRSVVQEVLTQCMGVYTCITVHGLLWHECL
jgi:hypothetical protein